MLRRKHDGSLASTGRSAIATGQTYDDTSDKKNYDKIHPDHRRLGGSSRAVASYPSSASGWALYLVCGGIVFLFVVGSMRGSSTRAGTIRAAVPPRPQGQPASDRHPINKKQDTHDHHGGPPPQPQRLPPEPHADGEDSHPDDSGAAGAPPPLDVKYTSRRTTEEARAAMLAQPSSFVDGEKKLKAELMKLKERQARGLDKGVRVLTQWLGDDIPVWTTKENEAEWKKKVDERMAKLQAGEEEFWAKAMEQIKAEGDARTAAKTTKAAADRAEQGGSEPKNANEILGDSYDDEKEKKDRDEDGEKGQVSTDESAANDAEGNGRPTGDEDLDEDKKDSIDSNDMRQKAAKDGAADASNTNKEYPSPAAMVGTDAVVILEPTFGQHRPDKDAIFAFAEGYDIKIYLAFIESLKATGFVGDIVLSVSSLTKLKPGVEDYLRAQPNAVIYTVDWKCFTGSGKLASGPKEGMRMCQFSGMYGKSDADSPDAKPRAADDPREARPVATARYELYWAWSLAYHSNSWIMLIDSRDTYFQTDPFKGLPRDSDEEAADGVLYFFEESAEATTIGQSSFNSKWLKTAYGADNVSSFLDKPVVCSGSTMGEQVAIEAYLRAMVAQFDETHCKVKGCDQGFHNYLHYSQSLDGVKGISSIEAHEQGKGIINNLGLLRDKPLRERGVLKEGTNEVLNRDGSISPVAHQFDRDDELKGIVNAYKKDWLASWKRKG